MAFRSPSVACSALLILGSAQAFSPPFPLRPHTPSAQVHHAAVAPIVGAPLRTARRSAAPTMLLSIPKALISIPTMYVLMSVNEYVTHRWYQHEEFNRDHKF